MGFEPPITTTLVYIYHVLIMFQHRGRPATAVVSNYKVPVLLMPVMLIHEVHSGHNSCFDPLVPEGRRGVQRGGGNYIYIYARGRQKLNLKGDMKIYGNTKQKQPELPGVVGEGYAQGVMQGQLHRTRAARGYYPVRLAVFHSSGGGPNGICQPAAVPARAVRGSQ